ncbi:MAG: citramalate synthase, partial [Chitinispirillaceae bacterium]|nr:citramalate synthase [Chitinispirillaceae bacterium]
RRHAARKGVRRFTNRHHMKNKKVTLYDTTLRDGNQGLGVHLSLADKLRIAGKLDDLGIHYIEGGWPNPTNTIDTEFYASVRKQKLRARIAAFGSTRRPGVRAADDPFLPLLVASEAPVITVFGKTWDLHVDQVLRTSRSENIAMIHDTVMYLKKYADEVFYDAEHFFDGYRFNPEYALATLAAARDAGADCLVLCDTNGGLLPDEFVRIFREVRAAFSCDLGVHMHNDTGCAAANSCLGVIEGANQVQGTINGLGERCGNANLCTIIPNLQLKRDISLLSAHQIQMLTSVSVFVAEIVNTIPDVSQPYVGEAAFSHKAGAHADAVRKVRASFEHVAPESVGNERHFVLSHQAGSSTMLEKLKAILPGIDKKDPRVKKLLLHIKKLEAEGYQFEAAEGSFELLARKSLGHFSRPFEVLGFRVIEEKRENGDCISEATIKVQEDDIVEHTAAEGDGPVNALDNALRKVLIKFYPGLAAVKLEDFKVRVLDGREGTEAKVRVLIESSDGESRWATVGVSTNIIEASWLALIDSLKYKLMKEQLKEKRH